jgi:hypothetical protein
MHKIEHGTPLCRLKVRAQIYSPICPSIPIIPIGYFHIGTRNYTIIPMMTKRIPVINSMFFFGRIKSQIKTILVYQFNT